MCNMTIGSCSNADLPIDSRKAVLHFTGELDDVGFQETMRRTDVGGKT